MRETESMRGERELLPWPKKLRQPRKPNIGACMLERSSSHARARDCLNFLARVVENDSFRLRDHTFTHFRKVMLGRAASFQGDEMPAYSNLALITFAELELQKLIEFLFHSAPLMLPAPGSV